MNNLLKAILPKGDPLDSETKKELNACDTFYDMLAVIVKNYDTKNRRISLIEKNTIINKLSEDFLLLNLKRKKTNVHESVRSNG